MVQHPMNTIRMSCKYRLAGLCTFNCFFHLRLYLMWEVGWRQLEHSTTCPCGVWCATGFRHFSQKTWKHWSSLGSVYCSRHIGQVNYSAGQQVNCNLSRACLAGHSAISLATQTHSTTDMSLPHRLNTGLFALAAS